MYMTVPSIQYCVGFMRITAPKPSWAKYPMGRSESITSLTEQGRLRLSEAFAEWQTVLSAVKQIGIL